MVGFPKQVGVRYSEDTHDKISETGRPIWLWNGAWTLGQDLVVQWKKHFQWYLPQKLVGRLISGLHWQWWIFSKSYNYETVYFWPIPSMHAPFFAAQNAQYKMCYLPQSILIKKFIKRQLSRKKSHINCWSLYHITLYPYTITNWSLEARYQKTNSHFKKAVDVSTSQ